MRKLVLGLIRVYQRFISPIFGQTCRFEPSCSKYTYQAIEKYGLFRGGWLGMKRVARCHPFNPGGFDPIP